MGSTRNRRGSFGFRPASQELHVLANHPEARTFLPGLPVVPGIQLKAAFNKNRTTLFQILACDFGLTSPQSHVDKSRFFFFLAIFARIHSVHRNADIHNRSPLGRVPYLWIPGEVAYQKNAVEICHKWLLRVWTFGPPI